MSKENTQTTTAKVVPLRTQKVLPGPLMSRRIRPDKEPAPRDRYLLATVLVVAADIAVFWIAVMLAYATRDAIFQSPLVAWIYGSFNRPFVPLAPDFLAYSSLGCFVAIVGLLTFRGYGLYSARNALVRQVRVQSLIKAVIVTYLIVMTCLYFVDAFRSGVVVLSFFYATAFVILGHFGLMRLQDWMVANGIGFVRTVLIASTGNFKEVAEKMHRCYGSLFQVVGLVASNEGAGKTVQGVPVLGHVKDLDAILQSRPVDRVIIALPTNNHHDVSAVMKTCRDHRIPFRTVPDIFELMSLRKSISELKELPVIPLGETPLAGTGWIIKTSMDRTLGLCGVIATGLLLPFIAAAIRLDSRGPIFYKQQRVGSDGKEFTMYKFRTMYEDAERNTGPIWAVENDPRCTPVGRFLRAWNLDELPQFWNVLRGDMSLVGPRPERAYFVDRFKHHVPNYMRRHMVKSGITGWAQVNGLRGDTSIEERTLYDVYYVENWSVFFDVKILCLTLFSRKNAY